MKYTPLVLCIVLLVSFSHASTTMDDPEKKDVILWFNDPGSVERFLKDAGDDFTLRYRYENAPGISGRITHEGLLRIDSYDASIYPDEELPLLLNQSRITVGANVAESYRYTGRNQTACILDTGVDYTLQPLGGCFGESCKVVGGYDFANNDPDPMDDNGHGTHIAGIIASNHAVYQGIAPNARVAALKVCTAGASCSVSNILAGLDWCITNKKRLNIQAISISIGAGEYTSENCPRIMDPLFESAHQHNLFLALASGNEGRTNGVAFPACARHVVSVGATYNKYVGKNYRWWLPHGDCVDPVTGPSMFACFTNRASNLDLLAPGAFVTSTQLRGGFLEDSGTSMAAPHVAAAVLLLKEASPHLRVDDAEALLKTSGMNVYDQTTQSTYKEIRIANALQILESSSLHTNRKPTFLPP